MNSHRVATCLGVPGRQGRLGLQVLDQTTQRVHQCRSLRQERALVQHGGRHQAGEQGRLVPVSLIETAVASAVQQGERADHHRFPLSRSGCKQRRAVRLCPEVIAPVRGPVLGGFAIATCRGRANRGCSARDRHLPFDALADRQALGKCKWSVLSCGELRRQVGLRRVEQHHVSDARASDSSAFRRKFSSASR